MGSGEAFLSFVRVSGVPHWAESAGAIPPYGLSGMVRLSDVPHWTKSAGSTPPRMFCLFSRAANVRARAYAHGRVRVCVCVCACIGLHEPLDLWRVYFAEPQSPTGPKKRIQGGDCCPRRMSLLRFPWLFPIRNPCELRGLFYRRSYFGPRTCGRGITNVIEVRS